MRLLYLPEGYLPRSQGYVIYDGPSAFNGEPIVGIITGLLRWSSNIKTGPMAQTYILARDEHPVEATRSGDDESICLDCPLRGEALGDRNKGRSCYVQVQNDPANVWKQYQAGEYPEAGIDDLPEIGRNVEIRLGAYGDPAAVPAEIWRSLLSKARDWTGYTRQWRDRPDLRDICMASVHSEEERDEAHQVGYRTYRVRHEDDPGGTDSEIPCPHEHDDRIQCRTCGLCKGTSSQGKSITSKPVNKQRSRNLPAYQAGRVKTEEQ